MQRTAFGADEVPEVKSRFQSDSTSGSGPRSGSSSGRARRASSVESDGCACESVCELDWTRRVVGVGVPGRDEHPAGRSSDAPIGDEELEVTGLGDDQLDVGVGDVASQVLAAPGVVEPDDAGPDQAGSTDRHDIVGRVVQQHRHVGRPVGAQPRPEHRANLTHAS